MSAKVHRPRNGVIDLLLATFLVALAICLASAAPPPQSITDGEAIFQGQCAGCHTIGGGRLVGPDLQGITQQRDRVWLARFIAEPDKVLAEGDPIASALLQEFDDIPMPNLGLSPDQVAGLIAYLDTYGGVPGAPPTQSPAQSLLAGDPARGQALFLGDVHLRNGGPPCLGCHSIDRAGALGGGVLGPDLTQAFAKYGSAGLASALATIPWPTMLPIYTEQPLTPEERADLQAFLEAASGQQRVDSDALVLALSLAGFCVAMILARLVWRHRLRGVRRPLVERARPGD